MHLILLGVVKKPIQLCLTGPLKTRLNATKVNKISKKLLTLRHSIPCEFSRKPRPLDEFRYWKATEFRKFLMYTGPIALKNVLPLKYYENFIFLHSAVRILSSAFHIQHTENVAAAQKLLEQFVIEFQEIYGKQFVSHKKHNLLHICADVLKFGVLDRFSAFKFKNYMTSIERMLRKGSKPLQ